MDRFMMFTIVTLVVLAYTSTTVIGQRRTRWPVTEYPNPQYNFTLCGRTNASSVCDPNNIISRENSDRIDGIINAIYRETRCTCNHCQTNKHGHIIKVAIMPNMERVYKDGENTTAGALRDAQMYAYMLSLRWQMDGACNETLLIVYAKNDGILYTLTRVQTRMTLSDSDVKTISLAVRHYFDRDDTIAAGLIEMILRYRLIFEDRRAEAFQTATVSPQG